ncbi:MAG TPA: M14 metallopeptidase family protein [Thermoanaerobaculia bacterium]|nr:M14 metallopeptidase family protein [Thermoanaerobaculia bacterium]
MTRRVVAILALVLCSSVAFAQVPTPEEFLGYRMGERFTPHHRILDYFEELTRRSKLITMQQIGETYEGRPLVLAAITSEKNHKRLQEIQRTAAALARGEGDPAAMAANQPAIVWLAFGVHGNESSSAEAAMFVASSLLREPDLTRLLDNLVILIDPLENPDGRERYITWFHRTRGVKANVNPAAAEHAEPWPGGRYNHYLIDMNRDWAFQSQKETQARVAAYQQWNPQVIVDFHEMSSDSSYFFPPDAKPINANLPTDVEDWLEIFGRANAGEFSKRGWTFFVGERYDLFYPGYGDSWPSLRGAIGMTYEQGGGGRAGSAIERADGTILTLADRALHHYTTAITTVRTAAQHREALLRYTHEAARAQIDAGKNTFLLMPGSPNFQPLVELLQKNGIRVDMLTAPAAIRATRLDRDLTEVRSFPAGTAVVSTKQQYGGLANTLLEKAPVFSKGFVEEQRAKAEADQPDDFYDLTTWSLPLAMNVEGYLAAAPVTSTREFAASALPPFKSAAYAYLVDGNDPQLYRFAGRLLASGIRFSVADGELGLGDRSFARGSLIILRNNNANDLDTRLQSIVAEAGVAIAPVDSGWMGATSFGSERVRYVKQPRIALVGGAGTDATSFGMLWHTLDVDTPIPHTVVFAESLRNTDFSKFDVVVFPDGSYGDRLGKRAIDKLKAFVSDGGTVIAIKGASAFLREKDVEISKLKLWEPPKKKDDEKPATDERYNDFRIPGSAFRTSMNERSYLTYGVPRAPAVLVEGSNAFLPVAKKVDNILTIDPKEPLISGVAWNESLERIKGSVYVVSEPFGRGQVITFADDPHFRLFWRGTLPIFLNAVLYSPSFPR